MTSTKIQNFIIQNFNIGDQYSKVDASRVGNVEKPPNSRSWTGIVEFENCIVLFVTLNKKDRELRHQYNDYFDDSEQIFYWDSQNSNTQSTAKIERIIDQQPVVLFARKDEKIGGRTQAFTYIGQLTALDYEGEKPVQFVFNVDEFQLNPNAQLEEIYTWKNGINEREAGRIQNTYKSGRDRIKSIGAKGQGRLVDSEKKKAIEFRAMEVAIEYYKEKGFQVTDTSSNNPYDLYCENDLVAKKVEAKGTQSQGETVNVTYNEVKSANDPNSITDLFIVAKISVTRNEGKFEATGGVKKLIENWRPESAQLNPTAYTYIVSK